MQLTALKSCPNCTSELDEAAQYCSHCGQHAHTHRFDLPHILHETFHAVTHADKGFLHLTRELALRPGLVAREYIQEGKRKRYFNPFTYLIIVLGILLLVNSITHPYTQRQTSTLAKAPSARVSSPPSPYRERQAQVSAFFEKNNKLVLLFAIPIISLAFWLFFRRAGLNYAEHLVANVFFSGFYVLFTALVLAPLVALLQWKAYYNLAQMFFQLIYLAAAYYHFLAYRRPVLYLKTGLASACALLLWALFSGGLVFAYIALG